MAETRFACLALNAVTDARVDDLQHPVDLGHGYRLQPAGGDVNLDSGREYSGDREIDEIHGANAWIWVEDDPSADLRTRLGHFETALLLTRAPSLHGAWILEGSSRDGVRQVSSFGERPESFIKEAPYPLTSKTLRHAAETADVLRRVLQTNALRRRLDRGFISLVLAMRMEHIEDSILYFMRALEGMLSANNSDQFKARAVAVLKSGSPELLGELYHVRNKLGHAEPIDEAFPGMTRPQAARRGRQLQAFLYHFATRAYRTILRSPDLMNRLTEVDVGAYWGDVVQSKVPPPFVVSVTDDVWDFDHDDGTHHLMRHEQVLAELQRDDLSEF